MSNSPISDEQVHFKIEMDVHISAEEAHLMAFAPERLQQALNGTKIQIDHISVTRKPEQNT